jgi:hypothetical protein
VTAPQREHFAASDYCRWRCLPLSIDVLCANDVLEAIRVAAVDGLNRISHGGLETGGILFGRKTEPSIEILESQPLECEHKNGPSFILSEKDEVALQAALSDPKLGALEPIGLYMTRSRRGFSLADVDQRILDRYFPKPWQMALLLMPAKLQPTGAGFFIRSPGSESGYVCAHYFLLRAPERQGNAQEPARPDALNTPPNCEKPPARLAAAAVAGGPSSAIPVDAVELEVAPSNQEEIQSARLGAVAVVGTPSSAIAGDAGERGVVLSDQQETQPARLPAIAVVPAPGGAEPVDRQVITVAPFYSLPAQQEENRSMSWWKLIAMLALVFLGAAIAGRLWHGSRALPSASVPLKISDLGRNVRIEWDPTREPVRTATGATLEIHDGDRPPVDLPITRGGLESGGVVYTPHSEKIEVRLILLRGSQPASESSLYFIINPMTSAASPSEAHSSPATEQAAPPVVSGAVSRPQSQEPVQTRTQKQEQEPSWIHEPPGRVRIVVRAFDPPVKQSSASAEVGTQASLPDLPEIHAAQPFQPVPLPSAPPIGVRPPPAPVSPAPVTPALITPQTHTPDPPQPRSGRLIWTGELRKNGLLALSPAGASLGVLNGRLPGFPVKVSVQPAELVDGGIAIFSSDQTKSGTNEPPSARNGWNVVVYKWDPKRTSDVTIIEPPGPSNGWRQLVLRTGNRNVSVLVVDWQREGGQ